MGIKSISNDKIYTSDEMKWQKEENSPAIKDLLADPEIAKVLDKPEERTEFFREMKQKGQGGLTRKGMREVLGKFRSGQGKHIDKDETMKMAQRIFPNSERYIMPRKEVKTKQAKTSTPVIGGKTVGGPPQKSSSSPNMPRIKSSLF
ncbi:MAG TPA: hypothetical protein PLK35_01690 [Candidatus Moranbacteria bacterium]|nr:hypothetical protein [Candidatus Moranbacteria bacterium]